MISYFENFTAYALLMDFFWASLLMLIAQILRSRITFLQNLFIPASVIAGLFGLLLSPEFGDVIVFSDQMSSYPSVLIILLFATLLLGHTDKHRGVLNTVWTMRDTVFNIFGWGMAQFGLAILCGLLLARTLFPGINEAIGILMPAGFYGGYGYGGAVGNTLESYGFENGVGLGMTFATLGMLVGIVGGMININIANRKGYLKFTEKLNDIPADMRTGLLPEDKRFSIGTATMSPSAIDPLSWPLVLIFVAAGLGWLAEHYINLASGISVPTIALAMLAGALLQWLLERIGFGEYVDKQTVTRWGSTFTDYLVFYGFCTIRKEVIAEYWGPILILAILGTLINLFFMWVVAPRTYHNNWFERGIIIFGMYSGVMATGVTLLRVVDPDNQSGSLEDTGFGTALVSIFDIFQVGMYPVFVCLGYGGITGVLILVGAAAFYLLMKVTGCFHVDYKRAPELN